MANMDYPKAFAYWGSRRDREVFMGFMNRRKYERIEVNIPGFILNIEDFNVIAKIKNISEDGLRLSINKNRNITRDIDKGDVLRFSFNDSFDLDGEEVSFAIEVDCKVMFLDETDHHYIFGCHIESEEYFDYVIKKKRSESGD